MTISTASLQGLIKKGLASEIINKVSEQSVVMQLANIKAMNAPAQEFPVRLEKAGTYWVNEGERIQTTEATWGTIELVVKKIGGISVFTKESVRDGLIDIEEEIKDQISSDIAAKLDSACLFGTGSPYGVNKSIFELSSKVVAGANISDDVSDVMGAIENEEMDVNAFVATRSIKNELRKAKDEAGFYIFEDKKVGEPAQLHGEVLTFTPHFDKTKAKLIAGNFDQVYLGVLEGIEFELLTEATVDNINLAQEDKFAIKATARMGFLVVDPKAFSTLTPPVSKKK